MVRFKLQKYIIKLRHYNTLFDVALIQIEALIKSTTQKTQDVIKCGVYTICNELNVRVKRRGVSTRDATFPL